MKFIIRGVSFAVEDKYVEYSPFLRTLRDTDVRVEKDGDAYIVDVDPVSFQEYVAFLRGEDFKMDEEVMELFDFMGHHNDMEYPIDYWKVKLFDNWVRDNFYRLDLCKDPHYGLVKIPVKKYPMFQISGEGKFHKLRMHRRTDDTNTTVLAGGAALWMAGYSKRAHDFDIFFTCDQKEAEEILKEEIEDDDNSDRVKVTTNTVNIHHSRQIQYIARIYTSLSEILHGFDVDCCGVGWEGDNHLWVTKRALYAIENKINWFDRMRASPSYGHRLAKYHSRGYEIGLPLFDPSRI